MGNYLLAAGLDRPLGGKIAVIGDSSRFAAITSYLLKTVIRTESYGTNKPLVTNNHHDLKT